MIAVKRCIAAYILLVSPAILAAAQQHETQLFDLNAYDPVPSPDGKLIAYVLTGHDPRHGSGGFGRSNLRSDLKFCSAGGKTIEGAEQRFFPGEWPLGSTAVVGYRSWKFALVSPGGSAESGAMNVAGTQQRSERVAYLRNLRTFTWIEYGDNGTMLQTTAGPIAEFPLTLDIDAVIVPSPDGRYLAIGDTKGMGKNWPDGPLLRVYDTERKTLANLGALTIHPDPSWDYIKPSWNPWFGDGKHLAFFSGAGLYVASPDGSERRKLAEANNGGLAVPSPDGTFVAYATFSSRPMHVSPDRNFWQGSTLWVVPSGGGIPHRVTGFSADETYTLRWLTQRSLIFDRISEGFLNEHARIWTVSVDNP